MKINCVMALAVLSAAPAAAQGDAGAVISASVGASAIESRTEWTVWGTAGYRFNRYTGLEIEVTSVPTSKAPFPSASAGQVIQTSAGSVAAPTSSVPSGYVLSGAAYSNLNGDETLFTTNMRVEMPMPSGSLTPYFTAGGGMAELRHSADVTIPIIIGPLTGGVPIPQPPIRTVTEHLSSASAALALTIGGGVSVRVTPHARIDGDLRYFRLLGDTNMNAGRFSVGARYRF